MCFPGMRLLRDTVCLYVYLVFLHSERDSCENRAMHNVGVGSCENGAMNTEGVCRAGEELGISSWVYVAMKKKQ